MNHTNLRTPRNSQELEELIETLLGFGIRKPSGHVPREHQTYAKMLMRAYTTNHRPTLERFTTVPNLKEWLEEIEENEDWEYLAGLLRTNQMSRII